MKPFKETLDEALVYPTSPARDFYRENWHLIYDEESEAEAVLKAAQTMQKLLPLLEDWCHLQITA